MHNDAHLLGGALLTHHCPWGVAVIAGTGSVVICLEVNDGGQISQIGRRGGTGYLLGDDGSGKLIRPYLSTCSKLTDSV